MRWKTRADDELIYRLAVCEAFGLPQTKIIGILDRSRDTLHRWRTENRDKVEGFRAFVAQFVTLERARVTEVERLAKEDYHAQLEGLLGEVRRVKEAALKGDDLALANKVGDRIEDQIFGAPKATIRHEGETTQRHVFDVTPELAAALNETNRLKGLPQIIDVPALEAHAGD